MTLRCWILQGCCSSFYQEGQFSQNRLHSCSKSIQLLLGINAPCSLLTGKPTVKVHKSPFKSWKILSVLFHLPSPLNITCDKNFLYFNSGKLDKSIYSMAVRLGKVMAPFPVSQKSRVIILVNSPRNKHWFWTEPTEFVLPKIQADDDIFRLSVKKLLSLAFMLVEDVAAHLYSLRQQNYY